MENDVYYHTKEIPISDYDDLTEIIKGKTSKCTDIRNNFIFRGVEDIDFQLIPSALRGDMINKYVDENFQISLRLYGADAKKYGFILSDLDEISSKNMFSFSFNKYGGLISNECNDYVYSFDEIQFRKELNVLLNFLDYSDKSGLKIPINQKTREFIEHNPGQKFKESYWPTYEFYELISLAQHYGMPTRALDWSYDYKVSLYFAIKNILNDDYEVDNKKPNAGVLWAFNYKIFQIPPIFEQQRLLPIQYYRPEYNLNPNLNAQKGLFTFIVDELDDITRTSFDQFILDNLNNSKDNSFKKMLSNKLPNDGIIFYKFIIPEEEKPKILNELYHERYSEEYLFPGYGGVTQFVENKVKLDKLLYKHINVRKNVLLVINNGNFNKIKSGEKSYIFRKSNFNDEVDKIFLYSNNEIKGYFKCKNIIENTPKYFLFNFCESFTEYDDKLTNFDGLCCAIKIDELHLFDYPIKFNIFKLENDYCYIENEEKLKFLLNFK